MRLYSIIILLQYNDTTNSGMANGMVTLDEAFPKQTLDKLRQLRVTLEQV